ncbi:M-phase phosphoprotein 8 isoform X4 [Gadus macrocephalus]|uniref:M-phase phosphoprotein 8 isoform X4 n=1 Tax=Gadus macrocephalus TaxID=80720 RepID=UPI0028CB3DB2|nr:M-phase phosphoprotein 8 isoform X4 [Gadus macrocephalus]
MDTEVEKPEPADSEQDEEEDVYEVERIIDMRLEEGEVLYRVRWKNYSSDDDTWEPEAHLEDCREVLLNYKKNNVELKLKRDAEAKKMTVPTKTDVADEDSESDSDKERPSDMPLKKKKKKVMPKEAESPQKEKEKEKKRKKKDKKREEMTKPLPAPETEDEEDAPPPSPPSPSPSQPREKLVERKKRTVDTDEEEEELAPTKKHRKDKGKEAGRLKKDKAEDGRKRKGKRERKMVSSEDEDAAPLEQDLSDEPSSRSEERGKQKKGPRSELKLQGFKDLLQDKKLKKTEAAAGPSQKEASTQKTKSQASKPREDPAPHSSDSSDSSSLQKKPRSKAAPEGTVPPPAPKLPPSSASIASSSSSSSSSLASAGGGGAKARGEEAGVKDAGMKEAESIPGGQKEGAGSTNLFEKFLLNCEAKDRVPRRHAVHQPPVVATETISSAGKTPKLIGKIEKKGKATKDSPAQKPDAEKLAAKQPEAPRAGQSHGFSLDSDEKDAEEPVARPRAGEDRRDKAEEVQRPAWERRTPADDRRWKRREDSEPRLFMACDDTPDPQDAQEGADKSRGQATLSLGMDLNLDWMTLEDFQKHLNGEDEILSGPPLSPSELRDAVKSGDYMSVKLALNSKEEYNLDQEDSSGMTLSILAAAGGQDDILRLLIRKGVRVNGRQKNGTTALMHAAEKNFLTTVAILLEAGSHVNAQTLGGETGLMKACKRGNADIVRLLLEYGADCNILSKHKNTAMYFAKVSNNLTVCDLIKDHSNTLSGVAEDTIRAYFESRLALLEPLFPLACHRLCEGPHFNLEFSYKAQQQTEGSGVLLFIFHANFLSDITARLCGPCSVHAVVLNDKFQLPIFLDSHFIYSFSPVPGLNRLFLRLAEAHTAKVKLLICAYRVQLQ